MTNRIDEDGPPGERPEELPDAFVEDFEPDLEGEPEGEPFSPAPSEGAPRTRKVIAVGGGRGGVGKTLLAVNLGVYLAQLGRSVALLDVDPAGSNLHTVLGLEAPPLVPQGSEGKAAPVPTSVPGLSLLPTAYDPMTSTPLRASRSSNWLAKASGLGVDYAILNLGAGSAPAALDLFLAADVGVCVTAPEPLAVETTYRFCRSLFARAIRRSILKERYRKRLVERAIAALPPLSSPREMTAAIRKVDESLGHLAAREMARITPRLVVGQTRLRSDLELGPQMGIVSERFLGIALDYIGHIEHDDAVWLTARRKQPLLIDSPTSKSARNVERVARRVLALLMTAPPRPPESPAARALPVSAATLYDVLGVSRTSGDDEIRRAYKRQRDIYRDGSLALASVMSLNALRQEQARIEEAYATLLDPVRRRAYDLSTFPDDPKAHAAPPRTQSAAAAAELAMLQAELAREIHVETQFSGALLRKVRESQGIEIVDVARRTKISIAHIQAIESETPAELPAPVYVQGFVQEVAKFLRLDPVQVQKTYMRRYRELLGAGRR